MLGRRTLVKLDVKNYGDLARLIEGVTNATGVAILNSNIQSLIHEALKSIGLSDVNVIKTEGNYSA